MTLEKYLNKKFEWKIMPYRTLNDKICGVEYTSSYKDFSLGMGILDHNKETIVLSRIQLGLQTYYYKRKDFGRIDIVASELKDYINDESSKLEQEVDDIFK